MAWLGKMETHQENLYESRILKYFGPQWAYVFLLKFFPFFFPNLSPELKANKIMIYIFKWSISWTLIHIMHFIHFHHLLPAFHSLSLTLENVFHHWSLNYLFHTFWTNYRLLPCRGFFSCPVTFLLQNTKEGGDIWSFFDGSTWCLCFKLGNFDYLSSLGSFICQILFFYFYFSFSILQINISFAQVIASKNAKHTFIAFPPVK